jgi:hypothetical protein
MKVTTPINLRLIVPAVLLAATGALGGSAVVTPATACAAPSWDIGSYELCLDDINESDPDKDLEAKKTCCLATGGEWKRGSDGAMDCFAPPIEGAGPAGATPAPPPPPPEVVSRPTVTPPTDAATETPPTPRLPVPPQPSDNATVAPQPAAPPTTSSFPPPPPR